MLLGLSDAAREFDADSEAALFNDLRPHNLAIDGCLPKDDSGDDRDNSTSTELALYAANCARLQPSPRDALSWAEPLFLNCQL